MKRIIFILIGFAILCGCSDSDDAVFKADFTRDDITFIPRPGGAVMHYKIRDRNIVAIRARYTNEMGDPVLIQGTYASNSIVLEGFHRGRTDIPISISVINERDEESAPFEMKFSTNDSAPWVFFEGLVVEPYWDGFQVTYEVPEDAEGLANVYYIGTNPMTQQEEPLLLETFLLVAGKNTRIFPLSQKRPSNTVIINTEDYKSNIVRQETYEAIEAYNVNKLDASNFVLHDPFNISIENDTQAGGFASWKYLFDGDTKGIQRVNWTSVSGTRGYYSFLAGPFAVGRHFIVDINKPTVVSSMRIYAILPCSAQPTGEPGLFSAYQTGSYVHKLPNALTIFGSNNMEDDDSWVQLGSYYESPYYDAGALTNRWYYRTSGGYPSVSTAEEVELADPAFLDINLDVTTVEYRYYKLQIDGIFEPSTFDYYINSNEYVSFHELEVFAKAE